MVGAGHARDQALNDIWGLGGFGVAIATGVLKSVSRNTSMCFALRMLRMQIGNPADLSARRPRYFLLLGEPQGCGECRKCRSNFRPKESIQRKGHPDAASILRAEGFERGFPKGLPSPCVKRAASLRRP